MDMLTLQVLAAQHPRAATCTMGAYMECADCALGWVLQDAYFVEDIELAPAMIHDIHCDTCDQKMEHHTWTS